jgi:hypothetical protein
MLPKTLDIIAYALVPGTITSLKWATYASFFTGISTTEAAQNFIFVSTCELSGGLPSNPRAYAYTLQTPANYEMGLNYYNASGELQEMTIDGAQIGSAVTGIIHASTNDTFTVIVDSNIS